MGTSHRERGKTKGANRTNQKRIEIFRQSGKLFPVAAGAPVAKFSGVLAQV
jgi:hypothetical protein